MALAVASTSTVSANDADSLTITKPSGVQSGDLLIIVASGDGITDYAACTGFTRILERGVDGNKDTNVAMLYRIADSSDVSASNYTITAAGATTQGAAAMLRVTGWTTGNPLYASSTAEQVIDSASYSLGASSLTLSRPTQQLLIIAGVHKSDDHYADYSAYTITSADSNPTWTIVSNNVDFTTAAGAEENTFFCAYATSSNTSTITAFSIDVASSITGGNDSDAAILAVICSPQSPTPDLGHLNASPTLNGLTVSQLNQGATISHLDASPVLNGLAGESVNPTTWTTIIKS